MARKRRTEKDFNRLWRAQPGVEFLDAAETLEGKRLLAAFLEAGPGRKMTKGKPGTKRYHKRAHPYKKEFRAFMDYFGMSEHEFDWESWREWYGDTA